MAIPTYPPQPKSELRSLLRRLRAEIDPATRRHAGRRVECLALDARLIRQGRHLGFYFPSKGELNILPLLNRALWLGAHCYLPVVPQRGKKRLWFTRMGDRHPWTLNRYGIPETGHRRDRIRVWRLDVLFIPMLGFDLRGYRMGMGGGYYDATLAYLKRRSTWRKPKLIGVAYERQRMDRLPEDPWDIPLDLVLTEQRIYRFDPRGR
jgi:5-formyltetrahydrofolate cyclo-ligase